MNLDYLWKYLAHRDQLNTVDLVSVSNSLPAMVLCEGPLLN
jgi:hypothetical protein